MVWWRLYEHKRNGTGQVHKMNKWLISKRGADEERLCPVGTEPGSIIGFTPANNPVQDSAEGVN